MLTIPITEQRYLTLEATAYAIYCYKRDVLKLAPNPYHELAGYLCEAVVCQAIPGAKHASLWSIGGPDIILPNGAPLEVKGSLNPTPRPYDSHWDKYPLVLVASMLYPYKVYPWTGRPSEDPQAAFEQCSVTIHGAYQKNSLLLPLAHFPTLIPGSPKHTP